MKFIGCKVFAIAYLIQQFNSVCVFPWEWFKMCVCACVFLEFVGNAVYNVGSHARECYDTFTYNRHTTQ